MSGRSPGPGRSLSGAAGVPCMCLLQRCLAVQLQRVSLVDPRRAPPPSEPPQQQYWMYDSGYLIFQGFLEANLKCFWNSSLVEAVRVLEFQGYVAPGVLLVRANPCALEVVRAAWARNVLKPPANYSISVVGDVEDCVIQPIPQGQFTPLPEALCWVILDLTSSGQAAVLDNIRDALHVAFPDMQTPTKEMVYDTLAKLMSERKIYQTSKGYFVVTPESRRLGKDSCSQDESRSMLMSTEEAVAYMHGEMETIIDGERTHQAIQTNLADVICGGNPNDKILYGRLPSKRAQLERRHSLRLFGSNKRLSALHRTGSMRHLPCRQISQESTTTETAIIPHCSPKKSLSLLSRLFRRSKRGKSAPLQTFSAQFPPSEWFSSTVRHLHSVGTQTHMSRAHRNGSPSAASSRSRAGSSSRSHMGDRERWDREGESSNHPTSSTLPRHHRRQGSASSTTPTPSRPPSRRSSPNPNAAPSISPSRSSLSSSKTVVNTKSLSSSSSGYNSLPRSSKSQKTPTHSPRHTPSSRSSTPKCSPVHSASSNAGKSSITLQVSTNQTNSNYSSQCQSNIGGFISSVKSSVGEVPEDQNSTTMTTTINGANTTKIFVQQQNSPVRSVITFENGVGNKGNPPARDLVILNTGSKNDDSKTINDKDGANNKRFRPKTERPTSLYNTNSNEEEKDKNEKLFGQLETQLKMKFPSSETIQLEEKLLTTTKNNKNNQKRQIMDSSKIVTGSLVDMTNVFANESELNNVRKASVSSTPLQSYNKTENLSVKNLLKDTERPFLPLILNKESKQYNSNPPSPTKPYPLEMGMAAGSYSSSLNTDNTKVNGNQNGQEANKKLSETDNDLCTFPSLSDLSLHFTSIAAQNILKGVSINSIDTLVEVNMAAEKQNNCDVTIHTDFGMV